MNCPSLLLNLLVAVAVLLPAAKGRGQGYAAADAAGHMTVPAGFRVELVAAEPVVRQPVAIEFDDRGRLWVIQYLQYPNPAGLNRVAVDRFSRTQYDRVPEPPPAGPAGADRISILIEDNGDGRADRTHDFVGGLNLASGLAFGHGGVFVLNVPYLLFYADRNRDDIPDADPEVLLTGFGMEDAHSVANSLTWGPDGWLYGCQGSTVTANIRGIEFQQGVWRYHPVTRKFELFCEGGGNSWGLDFDRHGNLLYSTNHGGFCMLHGVQGGYYWKSFGKHGALHNPHAYGYFDHVPHDSFHGGHVTVGGVVYQGNAFPPEFRDKYIAADLLGHAVYWHNIRPRGSTFATSHGGDLLLAGDTWFAPSDVTVGPDGAIYVADWHDQRTAHPDPDAEWDRSNGRIYRITAADAPATDIGNLHALPSATLADMLHDSNDWIARRARRILSERGDAGPAGKLSERALDAGDTQAALQALWALYGIGGLDDALALRLLDSPHEFVRAWTVRLLGDAGQRSAELAERLDLLAEVDRSEHVRSQLACTAKRLPAGQALPIINAMLLRDEDAGDPYIPLLLWWAVERHAVESPEQVLRRFGTPAAWRSAMKREFILPRLMRRYAAEGQEMLPACGQLLASTPDPTAREAMLAALDLGLSEAQPGTLPAAAAANTKSPAADLLDRVWEDGTSDPRIVRIAVRLGSDAARRRAAVLAADGSQAAEIRAAALAIVAEVAEPDAVPMLLALLDEPQVQVLLAVLDALQRFDDVRVARALLARYSAWKESASGGALCQKARDVLLSRKVSALAFLSAIERGQFEAAEVTLDQLQRVGLHQDRQLDELVRKLWGNVQPGTAEEKLAEVRRLNNDLRAGAGDLARGMELFKKHCATCHTLFGEGGRVGPDLTAANRQDLNYLLVSTVDPSAIIRKEFVSYVAQTADGRLLTGLLVEQSPASLTLLDAKNQRTILSRAEVEELEESRVSLMPEKILSALKPQELRDLFAYLQNKPPQ